MATTNASNVPETAIIPPTPGNGELGRVKTSAIANQIADEAKPDTQNPIPPASGNTPARSPQERRPSATEVIDAVLAEDEAKNRQQTAPAEAPATKSRTSSRSRSRSRPTSAAGSRRGSTSVWDNDPEKKQRKLVEKIFGHRWTPDFLK